MAQLTPIQNSFAAGELSPLMLGRSDLDGYHQGVSEMLNMFPDSRGPVISRHGTRFISRFLGESARIFSIPVNPSFFYTAIFLDKRLVIGSIVGHNPQQVESVNPRFFQGDTGWTDATDGNANSQVVFTGFNCLIHIDNKNGRFAFVTQEVTGLTTNTDYSFDFDLFGTANGYLRVGTTSNGGEIVDLTTAIGSGQVIFDTGANTSVWISTGVDENDISADTDMTVSYLGVSATGGGVVDFVTPYDEFDLAGLQSVASFDGNTAYVLHEKYPPYKLIYDNETDTFLWQLVVFTGQPEQWVEGSYPSTGTFFQGRLWLGGTPLDPQTFWGSQSGIPEDFTTGAEADDGLQFTLAKFGRIEWIVGFKNLMIGTANGEHIITSVDGVITPNDIQVDQQSSYGSASVQPQQVGDQIFYVSADRRKLRAIQYEWQADNWLSKDLTFNSEHITKTGVSHMVWVQNPANLFACILLDGTMATMVYNRSGNSYGWCKFEHQQHVIDASSGPIDGTDYAHFITKREDGYLYYETQSRGQLPKYMDQWVERIVVDHVVIDLDHFEGVEVVITVDGANQPKQIVTGGQLTLGPESGVATVGLEYTRKVETLPFDMIGKTGSLAPYRKRYNKIFVRVLNSGRPIINGIRPPTRTAPTPMDTVQPVKTEDISVVGLTHDDYAIITVEESLPIALDLIAVYGELGTDIT